jgi:uncharacterized protein YlxW (UPF0749 family)
MLMELQINDPEIVTARELATHANELKHLQDDMDKLVKDVEELKTGVNDIRRMLAEQQAEKKTYHYVGNVIAVLFGGVIMAAFEKFWK